MTEENTSYPKNGLVNADIGYCYAVDISGTTYGILTYNRLLSDEELHDNKLFSDPYNYNLLLEFFPTAKLIDKDNNEYIDIDGNLYPVEMTLSPYVSDDVCCRVLIDGQFYHFRNDDFMLFD